MSHGGTKPRSRRTSVFKTKPQIALDQLKAAHAAGVPLGTVLGDVAFGNDSQFRNGVSALALPYVLGVQSNMLLWKTDSVLPPRRSDGKQPSRPQQRPYQVSAKELALSQPAEAWQMITWREDGEAFTSRFARLRVRPVTQAEQPDEEWLLIEWPEEEAAPTKYWLSTRPADIGFAALVDAAKLRWRIERDYQDLKQEVGLGHYEGRGWRGLHQSALRLTLSHMPIALITRDLVTARRVAVNADWSYTTI